MIADKSDNVMITPSGKQEADSRVLVSVIVPVYNAEPYLPQLFACFDAQTFRDFEVILVDDGSSDGSLGLLEDYASRHANVAVIAQSNSGAGAARNTGIEFASGEYIAFLDADDTFIAEYLDSVYRKAVQEKADIVLYGYASMHNGVESTHYPRVCNAPDFEGKTVFSWRDDPDNFLFLCGPYSAWNRLYRRTFLLENDLWYPEIVAANDWPFGVLASLHAGRIAWLRETLYTYFRRLDNNSITANKKKRYQLSALEACEFTLQHAQRLPHYEQIRIPLLQDVICNSMWITVAFYDWSGGASEEMKEYFTRMPVMLRQYGVTDGDVEAVTSKHLALGEMLKILLNSHPIKDIENILRKPLVLALHSKELNDIVPFVENAVVMRGALNFSFSGVDVYVSCNNSEGGAPEVPEALKRCIESGWLRMHQITADMDSAWILEVLKNNPQAHLIFASPYTRRVVLGELVVAALKHPGAVVAGSTRTVFLQDGSAIDSDYWLETATTSDAPSENLWVGTDACYVIPHGVLDIQKSADLYAQMPEEVRSDEEYVLNALLQGCAVPVTSSRGKLPIGRGIGGSGHIRDIDEGVLGWIEANRAITAEDSIRGGCTRREYLELISAHYEHQHEENRQQLHEMMMREQSLEFSRAQYGEAQYTIDEFATGVVVFDTSPDELMKYRIRNLQERAVCERRELAEAQRRVHRLQSELEKARSVSDILTTTRKGNSPLLHGGKGFEWSEPKEVIVEIPEGKGNYQYRSVVKAKPGNAYRITMTMEDGNASSFEVWLWDREKRSGTHRKCAKNGESIELSFALLPDTQELVLLAYPERIGKTAGFDATVRAEIKIASLDM